MSEIEIQSTDINRHEPSEEDIFQVDVTRSELSYYICQNVECEAAKKFGEAGIGPLRKWPKGLYLTEKPAVKVKVDVEVQSPKKIPCGDPKCRYLNIHDDGSPKGCGKPGCKYARKICENPCCAFAPAEVAPTEVYCDVCGGYSITGKTCHDLKSHPALLPPPRKAEEIQEIYISDQVKQTCSKTCTLPPRPKTPPPPLPLPASDAPFDQLLGAANLETLRSVPSVFVEVLSSLNELVMTTFEKNFDQFNPHIRIKSQHRGEVFANNNFYNFYVETVRSVLRKLKQFLIKIWNTIIEFKKLDIPEAQSPALSEELVAPIDSVAHEIVTFLTRKLGLRAMERKLMDNVQTIVAQCVTAHRCFLPGPTFISPRSSQDVIPVEIQSERIIEVSKTKIPLELFYLGVKLGHKRCIPVGGGVPKNMGWLWTSKMNLGRLKVSPLKN